MKINLHFIDVEKKKLKKKIRIKENYYNLS